MSATRKEKTSTPSEFETWGYGPDQALLGDFVAKHGAEKLVLELEPATLARMLAKIAHAYAVAELGINAFEHFLSPLILGVFPAWHALVGGSGEPIPNVENALYGFALEPHPASKTHLYLVVRIRLFPALDGPTYQVVAGRLSIEQVLAERTLEAFGTSVERLRAAGLNL